MKRLFLFLIICMVFTFANAQVTKETGWHSRNLSGKVKSLRETWYKAVKVNGEIRKGKREIAYIDDASYFVYNDAGRKIETAALGKDGKVTERRTYVYDDNGIYTDVEVYDANGVASKHIYVNTYDEKGNLISREHLRPDGSLDNRYTYTYDNNGNMLECTSFGGGKAAGSKQVWKLDGKGNTLEDILYKTDGKIDWKFNYSYDEKGNRIEETVYKGETKFIIKYLMKYDEHGNEVETDWCRESGKIYRKYFSKYEYDSYSNWIKQTGFHKDKPEYISERELTYFSQ